MFYQLRFFNPSASESLISTQAGIIVGSKTAAQVCTGMLWGRLADSEYGGRKTVLMIGLICSGMSQHAFKRMELRIFRHLMHWIWII
jgi:MFS family permease